MEESKHTESIWKVEYYREYGDMRFHKFNIKNLNAAVRHE
jgi:hypothetical protein